MAKSPPPIFAIPRRFALRQAVQRHAAMPRGDQEKPWSPTMNDLTPALPQRYLRTPEAARFLGLSGRTLEKHRTYGTGPAYRKLGGRVVYSVDDLQSWANRGIWDADVLIWAASQIVEARDAGLKTSRLMAATPYEILTFVGRGTSVRDYDRLKAALDRLQSTTVMTSIRQPTERRRHRFSWINEWKETADVHGHARGLELILPDWFYSGVLNAALVLTIDRAYFDLTGGVERWLYRLVRKHGGRQEGGWSFDLVHLHAKSGSLSPLKHFAYDLREIVHRQTLPGYQLVIERGLRGDERLAFAPIAADPIAARLRKRGLNVRPGENL